MKYLNYLRFPAATVAAACIVLAGCGKVTEEATEAVIEANLGDGASVEINSDENGGASFSVKTEEGTVTMQSGESIPLPANFPKDIPVPDGVNWNVAMGAEGENGVFEVSGTVSTPLAKLATTMKDKITAQGWTNDSTFDQADEAQISSWKKEERQMTLSLSKDGDKTNVMITAQ